MIVGVAIRSSGNGEWVSSELLVWFLGALGRLEPV